MRRLKFERASAAIRASSRRLLQFSNTLLSGCGVGPRGVLGVPLDVRVALEILGVSFLNLILASQVGAPART